MIDRYTTESMGKIWSDYNKYQVWLDVEIAVLEVLCEDGIVTEEDLNIIKSKAQFSVKRILEIEEDELSIKATTTEKLGFEGREEGVSAYATVLIEKR